MKRLLALCSFGLVLGLAAVQFSTVEAKSSENDLGVNNMKNVAKKMKLGSGEVRYGSGKVHTGERRDDDCNSGALLSGENCRFGSGGKFGSGRIHTGEMKHLTGLVAKPKKIRWNEFNDDLHKALKFLDLKSLTKTEKKSVNEDVSQTRKDLKAIYKEMKTEYLSGATVDFTGYVNKLTNELSGFAADLRGYVKTGSISKFEDFFTKKISSLSSLLKGKSSKK